MAIIKCPECGHMISDKAPVCPSCGVEIAGKITRCTQCGEIYFKDQPICPNCHHANNVNTPVRQATEPTPARPVTSESSTVPPAIPTTERPEQPLKPEKKSKSGTILLAFLFALAVCAVCFYFYQNAKDNKEMEAYTYAMKSSDPLVLQQYLDNYADAPEAHRDSIQSHLTMIKQVDQDWNNVLVSNSKSAILEYLDRHPDSPHKTEALHKVDSIDWADATTANTEDAYEAYLEEHANGEHVDEAKAEIKAQKAKTVQPEEKQMISGVFRNFFQSINSNDEERLTATVNNLMTSFLGKSAATKSDVITFLHKIYKENVTNMNWHILGDYKIDKKEIGDEEYEYTVNFSAIQKVDKNDGSSDENNFKIKAKVDPEGKISEFNMTKILQ